MTVGDRFTKALKAIYPNAINHIQACVEDTGISQPSLSRAKKSNELTPSMVKFAKSKGISLQWLANNEGSMFVDEAGYDSTGQLESITSESDQVIIPYYKDVYASAGGDAQNHDAHRASPVTFSKEFLNTFLGIYNLKGISIINAAGDSMEPTIKSGELMFVAPMENEEFKDGGVYVIMCGNVLLVKRVTFNPLSGEYTLVSDNGRVDPVTISIDESSDCRFVGRVVGHLDRV